MCSDWRLSLAGIVVIRAREQVYAPSEDPARIFLEERFRAVAGILESKNYTTQTLVFGCYG
eukprot:11058069-Alexandrium_andersonii.AAC.1